MDVVGAIYDRCRYHTIGRGFSTKINCFINTQMDEISLYIVYINYPGSLSLFPLTTYNVATLKALLNLFQACNWHILFCYFYYIT